MNRRQFLSRVSLATALVAMPFSVWAKARPRLTIPPLIEAGKGRPVRIDFRPTQMQFEAGKSVIMWGANGQYFAPTVRMKSGDFIKLTYINSLPEVISVNIQGLLAPTEMIGSSHRVLSVNQSWSPVVHVTQSPSTCWYYADTLLHAGSQLQRGLAGLWIIEPTSAKTAPNLPNRYGVNDIPLILQDHIISKNGQPQITPQIAPFLGKRLFVNGQENPFIELAQGWVRLRIVNASLSRRYFLRLDNGDPLYWIATGMGTFARPVEREVVPLAPNERVEVLVNLRGNSPISLISGEKNDIFYKIGRLFTNDEQLIDNVILEMRPTGLSPVLDTLPSLPERDITQFHLTVSQTRHFQLRPKDRLINRQRFDPARIDFEAKLGSVERWFVSSNQEIGFTLQGAKFVVETCDGQAEPMAMLAWQDTVWLERDQTVTLLVKFEHHATKMLPFIFGVSDFVLRDKGAMGQFIVK